MAMTGALWRHRCLGGDTMMGHFMWWGFGFDLKPDLKDGRCVVWHLGGSAAATRPRSSPVHACPPRTQENEEKTGMQLRALTEAGTSTSTNTRHSLSATCMPTCLPHRLCPCQDSKDSVTHVPAGTYAPCEAATCLSMLVRIPRPALSAMACRRCSIQLQALTHIATVVMISMRRWDWSSTRRKPLSDRYDHAVEDTSAGTLCHLPELHATFYACGSEALNRRSAQMRHNFKFTFLTHAGTQLRAVPDCVGPLRRSAGDMPATHSTILNISAFCQISELFAACSK